MGHGAAELDGCHLSAPIEEIAGRLPGARTDLAHLTASRQEDEQVVEQRRRIAVTSPFVSFHGLVEAAAIVEVASLRHHPKCDSPADQHNATAAAAEGVHPPRR
jgi:hypothetical protein